MKTSSNARSIASKVHNNKVLAMHSVFCENLVRAVVFSSCVLYRGWCLCFVRLL